MHKPYILQTTPIYFNKVLTYHGIEFTPSTGSEPYITGADEYNNLLDINGVFSTLPSGNVIDRTQTFKFPFHMHIARPWTTPTSSVGTFEECIALRVQELIKTNQKINLFWSGGIDSTTVVTGFLRNSKNLSQVRVLYSTLSMKENPYFFLLLQEIPEIELVEFSGDVYLEQNLDGIFVNGDGADDLTASLDQSFFDMYGYKGLQTSWRDFFFAKTNNVTFVNFCEQYFATSGRDISTVLEARWWFYTNSKINKFPALASEILQPHQPLMVGFFDNYQFEHFMFFNLDKIIETEKYVSYKNLFKQYIYEFDKNKDYLDNKTKFNSNQIYAFSCKKMALKDHRYIILLADGTRIKTENLPLLSETEYRNKYQNTLDYLFNV